MFNIKKLFLGGIVASVLATMVSTEAKAAGSHYYNGMESWNANSAYNKAKKISNKSITSKHYDYANKTKYKAVGRVSNKDGFKGRGKDSMGTGFVVGDHTFVTNAHVVERANGNIANSKYITFDMNRDGKKIPYRFHAKSIKKVPSYDMVVVRTKENMVAKSKVKPLKIASNKKIKSLKFNSKLYSLGYGWHSDVNTKAYWNRLRFLQQSSNGAELMTKDKFRAGDSGSPMVNGNYEVFAIRTYGYNLRGNSPYAYAKQEVSGGESMYGNPRKFILKNAK